MLSNIRKRRAEGFTIIEVLIVLAIAGLILLVVFLAVPALQRNARNTQRREDAGNILSAVSEYVSNNNGAIPTATQANLGSGNTATLGTGAGINTVPINLGYYDAANVSVVAYAANLAPTIDQAMVVLKATCNGNAITNTGASARSTAILYTLEKNVAQCRAS